MGSALRRTKTFTALGWGILEASQREEGDAAPCYAVQNGRGGVGASTHENAFTPRRVEGRLLRERREMGKEMRELRVPAIET